MEKNELENEDIVSISFIGLIEVIKKEKWVILFVTLLFVLGGLYKAFTDREEFVSLGQILPEAQSNGGSSLGSIASIVGISRSSGSNLENDAIRPDLYPNVLSSTPFFLSLLESEVKNKKNEKLLFIDYFKYELEKEGETDLETSDKVFFGDSNLVFLDKNTEKRIINLKERVTSVYDVKTGIINVSAKMPDPVVAAFVTKYSIEYLTKYISDYRTQKLVKEIEFLEKKALMAKSKYYSSQNKKANYEDQFRAPTIRLQSSDTRRERLQNEYYLSANVYKELIQQLEDAKLKLNKETPLFKVLNPPNVPNFKSEPKKSIILIFSFLFGLFIALIVAIIKSKNYLLVFK